MPNVYQTAMEQMNANSQVRAPGTSSTGQKPVPSTQDIEQQLIRRLMERSQPQQNPARDFRDTGVAAIRAVAEPGRGGTVYDQLEQMKALRQREQAQQLGALQSAQQVSSQRDQATRERDIADFQRFFPDKQHQAVGMQIIKTKYPQIDKMPPGPERDRLLAQAADEAGQIVRQQQIEATQTETRARLAGTPQQKGATYVDPETRERYTQVFDPGSGQTQFIDDDGNKLDDQSVFDRLQIDTPSAGIYQRAGSRGRVEGKTEGEAIAESRDSYIKAFDTLDSLNQIEGVLEGQTTGAVTGSNTFQWLANAAEQLTGAKIKNFDPSKQQVAGQQIAQLLLSERQKLRGQGTISDQEQAMLEQTLPTLGQRPEALRTVTAILRRVAERQIEKYEQFRQSGQPFYRFEMDWIRKTRGAQRKEGEPAVGMQEAPGSPGPMLNEETITVLQDRFGEKYPQAAEILKLVLSGQISKEESDLRLERLQQENITGQPQPPIR